jgi:uncharacterized protein YegP (UPF0339 family)
MSSRNPSWRGERRLRLAIEVLPRGARVVSGRLVDEPAVQRDDLPGPWAARVDVDGQPVLVESFDDPRIVRGIATEEHPTHSYLTEPSGTLEIDVPLPATATVEDVTVHLADVSAVRDRPTTPAGLAGLFSNGQKLRRRATIGAGELLAHPEVADIAEAIGLSAAAAAFEVYRDRRRNFRWRLRRASGEIIAASGQSFPTQQDCEADVRRVRENAPSASIRYPDA